jgi:hypothetical protein
MKLASPMYAAVIVCVPGALYEMVQVAPPAELRLCEPPVHRIGDPLLPNATLPCWSSAPAAMSVGRRPGW